MENSRYDANKILFIFGMIALCLSLTLLFFAFYIGPFLLFGWRYDIPEFINDWIYIFTYHYSYSDTGARALIFLLFLIPGAFFGLIAYFVSNRIDNQIYGLVEEKKPFEFTPAMRADLRASADLSLKLFSLILLIIFAVLCFGWLIS